VLSLTLQYNGEAVHDNGHVREFGRRDNGDNREEANRQASQQLHAQQESRGADHHVQRKRSADRDRAAEYSLRCVSGTIPRLDRQYLRYHRY